MILALVGVTALAAGVIQRVTGLAFVLVLIGPIVLVYGPVEGVTLAVLLAVIASAMALPSAWRDIDWGRALWLLGAGLVAAPFGALLARLLPEPALLFAIAAMAIIALLGPRVVPPLPRYAVAEARSPRAPSPDSCTVRAGCPVRHWPPMQLPTTGSSDASPRALR
ncbi:sulfite exporter TauE/SafE family protein [Microbacterium sp. KHB019]|uniref:sulfite exporter TauE/SafE family protein n=1 Tax=Microbacterium sp. KHB019 TaxID=3129770 RepID=UPI00307A0D4E